MFKILKLLCICSILLIESKAQISHPENEEATSATPSACDSKTIRNVRQYSNLFQSEFDSMNFKVSIWGQTLMSLMEDIFQNSRFDVEIEESLMDDWMDLKKKMIKQLKEYTDILEKIVLEEGEYLGDLLKIILSTLTEPNSREEDENTSSPTSEKPTEEATKEEDATENSLPVQNISKLPQPQVISVTTRNPISVDSEIKPSLEDLNPYDEHFNCKEECSKNVSVNCRESKICTTTGLCLLQIPNSNQSSFFVDCYYHNTVIQKRIDGSVDFNRTWADYKNGFGNLNGEYWIGLDRLHEMTKNGGYGLNILMTDIDGIYRQGQFFEFRVGSESEGYELFLKGFWGGNKNDLLASSGRKFSTFDKDNDSEKRNCAAQAGGGWWFSKCNSSVLNSNFEMLNWDGVRQKPVYMVIMPVL